MTNGLFPINLKKWINDNRKYLKPPVANKLVFEENGFYIMVVGGPNERKDFHFNEGAEFFYQIEGDMILRTMQDNQFRDIKIKQDEVLLLPPGVPHSPQRFENTIGLVIERRRLSHEKDGLLWYCDDCASLLFESYFHLKNIETDFPPVFNQFFSNLEHRTCKQCGYVMPTKEEVVHAQN